jgi:N-acetyl-gamma-glutamyl-phosphate reductase
MIRVHVIGAAGYAAAEVLRLVAHHPELELGALESRSHAGQAVGANVPLLRTLDRNFDAPGETLAMLAAGEIVVCAGASGEAYALVPPLLARGARVVDLSSDLRETAHATLPGSGVVAVYGLTERYRDAIARARLVANPGCYPTATLLALLPLAPFADGLVQLVVDAKSGVTGAGRTPALGSMFAEVAGDVRAYGLAGHRHEPEIRQELDAAGIAAPLIFTPHVVPIVRGMLVDAYAIFRSAPDAQRILAAYTRAYEGSPFVRVLPAQRAPSLPAVVGTNDLELHVSVKGNVVRILAADDNLGKGAAGQAVQNINVMLGFPEECGFHDRAVVQ